MTVGLMTGSKRARSKPSVTNKTSIFGIMGGLTPMTTNVNGYGNERKNSGKSTISIGQEYRMGDWNQGKRPWTFHTVVPTKITQVFMDRVFWQ